MHSFVSRYRLKRMKAVKATIYYWLQTKTNELFDIFIITSVFEILIQDHFFLILDLKIVLFLIIFTFTVSFIIIFLMRHLIFVLSSFYSLWNLINSLVNINWWHQIFIEISFLNAFVVLCIFTITFVQNWSLFYLFILTKNSGKNNFFLHFKKYGSASRIKCTRSARLTRETASVARKLRCLILLCLFY